MEDKDKRLNNFERPQVSETLANEDVYTCNTKLSTYGPIGFLFSLNFDFIYLFTYFTFAHGRLVSRPRSTTCTHSLKLADDGNL